MALHLVAAATNADRDIKSASIAVLTETPATSGIFQGLIKLGDGTKNLSATGGAFQLVITVGGQTVQPSPQTVTFSTAVRSMVWTVPFPVVANDQVVIKILSPNAADSDVDCTAYLFDITYGLPDAVAGANGGIPTTNGTKINQTADLTAGQTIAITRPTGAVATDGGNSATAFKTNLSSSVNDFWIGSYLKITSGALLDQVKKVSDYDGTNKIITVSSAFTGTPAAGVTFALVNE